MQDLFFSLNEGESLLLFDVQLLAGATDPEGDQLSISEASAPSVDDGTSSTTLSRHQTEGVDTVFTVYSEVTPEVGFTPEEELTPPPSYEAITADDNPDLLSATSVYLSGSPSSSSSEGSSVEVYADGGGQFFAYSVTTDEFGGIFGSPIGEVSASQSEAWLYAPDSEFSGEVTLTYTIEDNGTPIAESVTKTASFVVFAVDDLPKIVVTAGPVSASEDTPVLLGGLSVEDVDYKGEDLEVHLTVTDGTLQYENLRVDAGEALVLSGDLGELNAKLSGSGRVYEPDLTQGSAEPTDPASLTAVTTEQVFDTNESVFTLTDNAGTDHFYMSWVMMRRAIRRVSSRSSRTRFQAAADRIRSRNPGRSWMAPIRCLLERAIAARRSICRIRRRSRLR